MDAVGQISTNCHRGEKVAQRRQLSTRVEEQENALATHRHGSLGQDSDCGRQDAEGQGLRTRNGLLVTS